MGRLSDQLAHDLKNPVAAIRGAADLLLEEHARGKPLEPQVEFVSLIRREADRLARLIDTYRRFGRVELQTNEVDVRELLQRIAGAPWIDRAGVSLAIDGAIPKIAADADLLLVVFENLVKNAIEADAKRVVLRAREEERALAIDIEDDGKGMDPRERELAFEELYTTKDMGSGLGLPFARRIVEAHGGRLTLKSDKGRGTTISIALPIDARTSAPPPAPR
jgi:signal transduction histidine kinase